jgi:hypothetical protein
VNTFNALSFLAGFLSLPVFLGVVVCIAYGLQAPTPGNNPWYYFGLLLAFALIIGMMLVVFSHKP